MRETESPIEDLLLDAVRPLLAASARITPQVDVDTACGRFRLDFVIEGAGLRVGVECDGAAFHDESRDEWRDAMIIGGQCVDEVFRFRGADLHHRIEDCLYVLARSHPYLFSERGAHKIERHASEEARVCVPRNATSPSDFGMIQYEETGAFVRFCRRHAGRPGEGFWREMFAFAAAHPGVRLDETISSWRAQARAGW